MLFSEQSMKFAEVSGGRDYVSVVVVDDLIHGAC